MLLDLFISDTQNGYNHVSYSDPFLKTACTYHYINPTIFIILYLKNLCNFWKYEYKGEWNPRIKQFYDFITEKSQKKLIFSTEFVEDLPNLTKNNPKRHSSVKLLHQQLETVADEIK